MAIDYIEEWGFIHDAYSGSGGFYDGSQLDKFGRESDSKYSTRQKQSKREFENLFDSKVTRYIGYLLKQPPDRQTDNPILQEIIKDADNQGSDINIFIQSFAKNAKAMGVNLLLVDAPKEIPGSLQDQIDQRKLPYIVEIHPYRVTKYKLRDATSFEWVAYEETVDNSTFDEENITTVTRYWDETEWRVYDDQNNLIDSGVHNYGVCPVLIFSEKGKFQSTGEFAQLAGMSKKLFNLDSELKLILRDQTFSILAMQADRGVTPSLTLGTDNVLLYTGEKGPYFISADAAQADVYETRIMKIKEAMDRVAYDVSVTKAQETAQSLQIKFEALNASLNGFAQRLEELERKVWTIITASLGIAPDAISVSYAQDFSILDLQTEIEVMDGVTATADLPQYKAAKLKKIIKQDLPSLEQDELQAIYAEIDIYAKQGEVVDEE